MELLVSKSRINIQILYYHNYLTNVIPSQVLAQLYELSSSKNIRSKT